MTDLEKYQVISLYLSDGRVIKATVKAFCEVGDKLCLLPQIEVTEPRKMPKNCYWSTLVKEGRSNDDAPSP